MSPRFFPKAPRHSGVGLLLLCAACALGAASPGTESFAAGGGDLSARACDAGAGAHAATASEAGERTGSERPSESPIEIPLPRIGRRFRTEARTLLDSPTVVRRLPARRFIADKRTYDYLLDHLSVASRLSGVLGYGYYRLVQEEDGRFHGWDHRGVEGDVWLIYSDPNERVYIGEGSYDTWYTPKISAKVLLAVRYSVVGAGTAGSGSAPRARAGAPGRAPLPPIVTRVDIYVQTSRLVGYLMELLGQVTDKKLAQLVSSAQYTSQALSRDPERVWNRMKRSGKFTPEELEDVRRTLVFPAED
jgi:hypothetical protein